MTALRITGPGGIVPRIARRQLPDHLAQEATNITVAGGEWRPMRKPKFTWQPSAVVDPPLSVARLDDSTWLAWTTANVRVERAPLEGTARYIISGDGVPKATTVALASPVSSTGGPNSVRALGVPAPAAAPGASHAGGVGAATSRSYCYTWVTDWIEEGPPSPACALTTGKVDGTWSITGMTDTPPNSGSITGATAAATTVSVTTSAAHYLRVGDQVTIASVTGMTDLNGLRTVTAVADSTHFTVALTTVQTYTAGGTWARTVNWASCTKRLYRTTGSTGAWQLVAESISGTSYSDTLTDSQILGDDLITNGWEPPPGKLTGIVAMPGGMLWGWIDGDRVLCACEPYQPHAWPVGYQVTVPEDIVGIAPWDNNLGVATKGPPVVLSGLEPGAMSQVRHAKPFPCVSRSSVASIASGAVFATRSGLARMDAAGVEVFTEPLFLPDQWAALVPATMQVGFDGVRLYLSSETRSRVYSIDIVNGNALTNGFQHVHCLYTDNRSGALFYCLNGKVYEYEALDSAPTTFDWWSKEYVLTKPANLGAARVEVDARFSAEAIVLLQAECAAVAAANAIIMAQPQGGRGGIARKAINVLEVNGSILDPLPTVEAYASFTLYSGDKVICSYRVTNDKAFRLPAGYKTDAFSVRLQGNTVIRSVALADTPGNLAQV